MSRYLRFYNNQPPQISILVLKENGVDFLCYTLTIIFDVSFQAKIILFINGINLQKSLNIILVRLFDTIGSWLWHRRNLPWRLFLLFRAILPVTSYMS